MLASVLVGPSDCGSFCFAFTCDTVQAPQHVVTARDRLQHPEPSAVLRECDTLQKCRAKPFGQEEGPVAASGENIGVAGGAPFVRQRAWLLKDLVEYFFGLTL